MQWFSDLKIAKKLAFTFALTALVAAVIGITGARALRKVADADTELYKGAMVPAIALEQTLTHFHRMRSNLWQLAIEKDAEKRAALAGKVKERRESIEALEKQVVKELDTPELKALYAAFKTQSEAFGTPLDKALEAGTAGRSEEAVALLAGELDQARVPYQATLETLAQEFVERGKADGAENESLASSTIWTLLVLTGFCFAASVGLGFFTTRQITAPLAGVVSALTNQNGAGASAAAQTARRDEIGDVFRAAMGVVENVKDATRKVGNMSVELASAAEELSATTQQMASSNVQVANQTQSLSTAAEEMSSTVDEVARSAAHVGDSAEEAHRAAVEGAEVVSQTVRAMGEIAEAVKRGADSVVSLGSRSDAIGAVVAVIEDIADQTNLLALNAAIEAARAGDHGRGFAVVADEVRKLAEKTVKATGEISATIRTIQLESRQAVESMEQTTGTVAQGTTYAGRAGASIRTIEEKIGTASERAQQIASATEELSITIHAAAQSVEEIARGVEMNTAASDEISRTAASVAQGAGQLEQIVRQLVV